LINIPLTPSQFEAKKSQLQSQHGIALSGTEGHESAEGYGVDYKYDGVDLQVTVTDTPRFVPKAFAEHRIAGWLTS
jgi:hypothetical protein